MAPKKHSGFMMFVNEWRNHNAEGRRMTLAQAVSHCGTIWEKMTTQQRGPYNSGAKDADVADRGKRERLNCYGQGIAQVDLAHKEAAESLMHMKRTTERLVINAKKSYDLENAKFVFATFNYFTKALTTDVYVPAEFAACEYSLKEGVRSIYSTMIDPGQIIFGQGSDALHHSSTTHDLPLPPNALGEKNMAKLYRNIVCYLTKCQGADKPLIVFTPTENIAMVNSCFRYLECEDDSGDGGRKIQVFDIQYLLFILKKAVMDVAGLNDEKINKFVTDAFFKKDFFEFTSGIACQYHEDNDRTKYCTQSMVTRWAYTFSDFMCGDLAITVQPGKHIPAETKPNYRIICSDASSLAHESSFESFYSCPGSRVKKETQSEDFSLSSSQISVASRSYTPTDHTSFTTDLTKVCEFPSLGMRKSSKHTGPSVSTQRERNAGAWNLPAHSRSIQKYSDNDFSVTDSVRKLKN
ncbi:protein maelstrom [Drosophila yakuba]|uniref:Protein maelstrom n=2 Tax=Drosophila yakuba TaxID=7245 RepID=MAEL_DROYA|nr:protein maelstrom [Drosophila yakuba]B4PIP5.2 RecName: Full=Protein maelstrom [Drosophila yakuba]EDW95553.2 mael, isoform J [Drosophila yakuba]KRK02502.1 mael, isoform B [Drosophila yakuba]KRK02503.1 mael, isoform C [Drosophila yakuba]KRK02504.1 mael, isoform D [Drosophila yakuba]KRK02505.1 mael, isoform E [Drosophila yakuba]